MLSGAQAAEILALCDKLALRVKALTGASPLPFSVIASKLTWLDRALSQLEAARPGAEIIQFPRTIGRVITTDAAYPAGDPISQLRSAMYAAGIRPPDIIITDGRLHRFSADGRRHDAAGWYVVHNGEIPAGAFGCWCSDIKEKWRADIGRRITPEEEIAHKALMASLHKKAEEEKAELQAAAMAKADRNWRNASPIADGHPYLARKGVGSHGLRRRFGSLVVP
jgi:phage/plasmid primase-like uncharacterized protein